jgi:hypothetical protein
MIHELTIGYFDAAATRDRQVVALRPLDEAAVARALAEFPGIKTERWNGCLIAPWHGRDDADRGEASAAQSPAHTGCPIVDR